MKRVFFLLLAGALSAHAATPLPTATPANGGLSPQGIAQIDAFFAREIAADRTPGAVVAIARDGKLVFYKAYGYLDKAKGTPMPHDAIFSITSMTKPMVSVVAMQLMEQGRLPLRTPLYHYLPAFEKMKVGTQDAERPILLHDLLRHTAGFTLNHRDYPNVYDDSAQEYVDKLARVPLLYQPGAGSAYSNGTTLLGLAMEKVTGKPLGAQMQQLWDTIGMPDTSFAVPDAKKARIARPLPIDPLTKKPQTLPYLERPTKFDCAAGCAFSTVPDYVRFAQMLLNGGSIDGKRVLAPATVAFMTSDHTPIGVRPAVNTLDPHHDGFGFGLGVFVRTMPGVAAVPGSVGEYYGVGASGSIFMVDPARRLVVVIGMAAPGDIRREHRETIGDVIYGALDR